MPKRMADEADDRGHNYAPAKKSKRAHKLQHTPLKSRQEISRPGNRVPSEDDRIPSSSSKVVSTKTQTSSSTLPQHNKQKANPGIAKPQWRTKREKKRLRKQLLKQQRKLSNDDDSHKSGRQGPHNTNGPASNSLNAAVSAIERQKHRDQHVCTRTTLMCPPVKLWTVAKKPPVHAAAKTDVIDTEGQASPSRAVRSRQAPLGCVPTTPSLRRELLRTTLERQECGESGLTHRSTSSCSLVTPVQRLALSKTSDLGSTVNQAGAHDPRRTSLQLSQRALTVPSRSTPVNAERTFQDFSRFVGESSDPSDDDDSGKSDADDDLKQKSKDHVENTLDNPDPQGRRSTSPRNDFLQDAEKTVKQVNGLVPEHNSRDPMYTPRQRTARSSQRLTHAAISNTDDEDDNVEQELFDDIRKVWEEVTSITRSTSFDTRNTKAPVIESPSMIRKPKIGYYDLPAGPLSAHMIMCQQAAVVDQQPPANRKRKRVSGVDSKHLPLDNDSELRTAATQKNATSTKIDASLSSTSDPEVRQTNDHNDSDAAQITPRISKKRRAPAGVSTALFPPISSNRFGLLQEKLWQEPFWLLIAVTFLNKTAGKSAAPVFWELKECYPTPADLANAKLDDVRDMITHLGLQTQRATRILKMAKAWHNTPPVKGRLHRTLHYPQRGEGKEFGLEDAIEADMPTVAGALEIGNIPGCGPYAWDSWRIFCRDVFRGVADDYNGLNAGENFEPEWQRVLPMDKELRACLRWMWLREGYIWDHETGSKREVNDLEREKAINGELGPTDEDEIKFTARAQEIPLTPVKAPTRRSVRLSGS